MWKCSCHFYMFRLFAVSARTTQQPVSILTTQRPPSRSTTSAQVISDHDYTNIITQTSSMSSVTTDNSKRMHGSTDITQSTLLHRAYAYVLSSRHGIITTIILTAAVTFEFIVYFTFNLQAMFLHSARIARYADRCNSHSISVCPYLHLSVRLSDTFRCFVETNEATIVRFQYQVGQSF